jgi:hypothetical protein
LSNAFAQPRVLLLVCACQTIAATARIKVGLFDPITNRLAREFEFIAKFVGPAT